MREYDVIIAGAGFAGLSVASRLDANVLVLDRYDIGSHNISACGTLVETMKKVGCEKSILQEFDVAAIHGKGWVADIPLVKRFCTIDYERFCRQLNRQNNAEFMKATVGGVDGGVVKTGRGEFKAGVIVDATGWPAAIASSIKKDYTDPSMLSYGIETEIEYSDDKLRFFVDSTIIENGVAWLFPAGEKSRFGVGSYVKNNRLIDSLTKFVGGYGLEVGGVHGGCFSHRMKEPVVDGVFVVGDAAGQTLPLTAEGIRRCIEFGLGLGGVIQNILDEQITLKQGLKEYERAALRGERYYNLLLSAQRRLPKTPDWQVKLMSKILGIKPIGGFCLEKYMRV